MNCGANKRTFWDLEDSFERTYRWPELTGVFTSRAGCVCVGTFESNDLNAICGGRLAIGSAKQRDRITKSL